MGSGGGGRSAIGTKGRTGGISEKEVSVIDIKTKGRTGGIAETEGSAPGKIIPKGGPGGSPVRKKSKKLTVSITNPKDKKTVTGPIEVKIEVSGGRGKIDGSVLLNGASIGKIEKRGASRIPYDTMRKTNGAYELKAIASDSNKRKDIDTIQITINNRVH